MKTLEDFDFGSAGSRSSYDWDEILNGEINVLVEGEEFTCQPNTFGTRVRTVAKNKGLKVRVAVVTADKWEFDEEEEEDDKVRIVVKAYKPSKADEEFEEKAGGKSSKKASTKAKDAKAEAEEEEEEEEEEEPEEKKTTRTRKRRTRKAS